MENPGETLKRIRIEKKLPLRIVAADLEIDKAILSKIERGERNATREQLLKLARYFSLNEDDLYVAWLSNKLIFGLGDDTLAAQALQVAEEKVAYAAFIKTDRIELLEKLKQEIKKYVGIKKAWIYGSFARGDDGPKSDVDIAIESEVNFSYFDLAEVQYNLEQMLSRKIDMGFIDSFKPYVFENVKNDLKLIYEK